MSDIQSFRLCGSHVAVAFGGGGSTIFGSGSHSVRAEIDGQAVTRALCSTRGWVVGWEDNGFVGHSVAHIPFGEFLKINALTIGSGSYPGHEYRETTRTPREWIAAYSGGGKGNTSPKPRKGGREYKYWRTWVAPRHSRHTLVGQAARRLGWEVEYSPSGADLRCEVTERIPALNHRTRRWEMVVVTKPATKAIPAAWMKMRA